MYFTILFLLISGISGQNVVWTDLPGPRTTTPYNPSACGNGGWNYNNNGGSNAYAYACIHHALMSDDMIRAAAYDGLSHDFLYGIAGGSGDSECGICYQIQLLAAEKVWKDDFPQLIIQVVNSGFDVMSGQLDIMVGAGGQGYFTAVNSDCGSNYCQGGPCAEGMFEGDFDAWTDAEYPNPNQCYSGGIKYFDSVDGVLEEKCRRLSGGKSELKDRILWDSCIRTNQAYLHQNFYGTNYLRVQCPEGLYRMTGLRRSDDEDYPHPDIRLPLTMTCGGSIEQGRTCVTTMHDGCVPSCAWPGKVSVDPAYPRVDRCDKENRVL